MRDRLPCRGMMTLAKHACSPRFWTRRNEMSFDADRWKGADANIKQPKAFAENAQTDGPTDVGGSVHQTARSALAR